MDEKAAAILREVGYDEQILQQVRALNLKQNLSTDPDCQTLEDALCLVFLERQFAELAAKTSEEKIVTALQKCWGKMSSAARQVALSIPYTEDQRRLLNLALGAAA